MTDEELVRSLLRRAMDDLIPPVHHPAHRLRLVASGSLRSTRVRPHRRNIQVLRSAAVSAVLVAAVALGFVVLGNRPQVPMQTDSPRIHRAPLVSNTHVLDQLAASVQTISAPNGRYVVQTEVQTEGTSRYLKASIIDSETGSTWTYQRGPGVPSVLPMAPGFSPTEAELQTSYPTDPTALRSALLAQATGSQSNAAIAQTSNDLVVNGALNALWNPLVQPALRSALLEVIAASPGVTTSATTTDSLGRPAVEISYLDVALGERLSVFLDPKTGEVLETSRTAITSTGTASDTGEDLFLRQYWTTTFPTGDPLNGVSMPG
jgi:hypothetical protein